MSIEPPVRKDEKQMHSGRALVAYLCAICLFTSVVTPAAFAQQLVTDDWTAVQSLTPSEEIVITLKSGKKTKGKFLDAGASEVSIERNGKRASVAKDTIAQIHHLKGKDAPGKWAAIGAGVGGGAGFGIGRSKDDCCSAGSSGFVGAIIGLGAGAVAGYFFGATRRKRTLIYKAP